MKKSLKENKPKLMSTVGYMVFVGILCLALTTSAPFNLQAQPAGPHKGCPYAKAGGKGSLHGLAAKLDLTQEQVSQIEAIKLAYLKETADLKNEIYKKQLAITGLIKDPNASDQHILALEKEKIDLVSKQANIAATYRLKVRALLTPDQIRKMPAKSRLGIPGPDKSRAGCKGCPHKKKRHKAL